LHGCNPAVVATSPGPTAIGCLQVTKILGSQANSNHTGFGDQLAHPNHATPPSKPGWVQNQTQAATLHKKATTQMGSAALRDPDKMLDMTEGVPVMGRLLS
jgi:hypothetical protein